MSSPQLQRLHIHPAGLFPFEIDYKGLGCMRVWVVADISACFLQGSVASAARTFLTANMCGASMIFMLIDKFCFVSGFVPQKKQWTDLHEKQHATRGIQTFSPDDIWQSCGIFMQSHFHAITSSPQLITNSFGENLISKRQKNKWLFSNVPMRACLCNCPQVWACVQLYFFCVCACVFLFVHFCCVSSILAQNPEY